MRLNTVMRLLALACVVAAEETCLLSLRTTTSRTEEPRASFSEQWASLLLQHRAEKAGQAPQPADIDAFIKAQLGSADHCHARLLEARRTLDGIEAQVTTLADSIKSSHDVELSNTKLLKDALAEKDQAVEDWEAARAECEAHDLDPEIAQYRSELEELQNIANPQVRSEIAHGEEATDYAAEARSYAEQVRQRAESDPALKDAVAQNLSNEHGVSALQWGSTQCQKFASFLSAKSGEPVFYTELSCNETRDNLQNEFTTSYLMIAELYNKGVEQASEDLAACLAAAKQEYQATAADVDTKIRDATTNIFQARSVLDDLTPLHQTLTRTAAVLEAHLESLRGTCSEAEEVSEHLERVRRLIRMLDACPGRNDFVLEVPEVET